MVRPELGKGLIDWQPSYPAMVLFFQGIPHLICRPELGNEPSRLVGILLIKFVSLGIKPQQVTTCSQGQLDSGFLPKLRACCLEAISIRFTCACSFCLPLRASFRQLPRIPPRIKHDAHFNLSSRLQWRTQKQHTIPTSVVVVSLCLSHNNRIELELLYNIWAPRP